MQPQSFALHAFTRGVVLDRHAVMILDAQSARVGIPLSRRHAYASSAEPQPDAELLEAGAAADDAAELD